MKKRLAPLSQDDVPICGELFTTRIPLKLFYVRRVRALATPPAETVAFENLPAQAFLLTEINLMALPSPPFNICS